MEQNSKFRLRLNLFDGIVLVLALAVAAVLAWTMLKPAAPAEGESAPNTATIRYTVRFQRWLEGTGELVKEGDVLIDNVKNFELGTVVSAEVIPCKSLQFDRSHNRYIQSVVPGCEDVLVTIEAPCTVSDSAVTVGGSYEIRVGGTAYIRGVGYMASGNIISMEREGA